MKLVKLMKKWARGFAFPLTVTVTTSLFAAEDAPYLAENLSVWLRADKGLATNADGAVTAWANQGTLGAAVDIAPHGSLFYFIFASRRGSFCAMCQARRRTWP